MSRVKMNAKHEYEYIANFKVMQNIFKSKKIEKVCSVSHTWKEKKTRLFWHGKLF